MKNFLIRFMLVLSCGMFVFAVPPPLVRATEDCLLTWQVVPSPNVENAGNGLYGVAALAPNDVWAVGSYTTYEPSSVRHSTILHWDGSEWTFVPHPDVLGGLNDIYAVSTSDIWAVGGDPNVEPPGQTTGNALHWDGVEWVIVPGVERGGMAISALNADDVWIAGNDIAVYHWNGLTFERTEITPFSLPNQTLSSIKAFSDDDVWVVGNWFPGSVAHFSIVYHWNGTLWQEQDTNGSIGKYLFGIDGVATNNLWIAGRSYISSKGLVQHWNGKNWKDIPLPFLWGAANFSNLQIREQSDGWLVGNVSFTYVDSQGTSHYISKPLIERLQDGKWIANPISPLDSERTVLSDVAAIDRNEIWTVGHINNDTRQGTLVMRGGLPCVEPPSPGAIPELVSPSDGEILTGSVMLDWREVIIATSYQVQLWRGGRKKHPLIDTMATTTTLTLATLQPYRAGYRWRVRACNEAGCGQWSKTFKFLVR